MARNKALYARLDAVERQRAVAKAQQATSVFAALVGQLDGLVAAAKVRNPLSSEFSLYSLDAEFARELDRILALT